MSSVRISQLLRFAIALIVSCPIYIWLTFHGDISQVYLDKRQTKVVSPAKVQENTNVVIENIRATYVEILQHELYSPDFSNAELILPALVRFYRDRYIASQHSVIIFDVGANVGETSALLVHLFTPINCVRQYRFHSKLSFQEAGSIMKKDCSVSTVHIIAVEAQASNFNATLQRGLSESWTDVGWEIVHAAMSKAAKPGEQVTFYGFSKAGHQQGSFAPFAAGAGSEKEIVKKSTIDMLLKDRNLTANNIYLLKTDVEGFDAWVLQGAQKALSRQAVKWILFEYNGQWKASSCSLKQMSKWLANLGYDCFFIVPSAGLIPIHPPYWHDAYEIYKWSNILCGRSSDIDVAALVSFMAESRRNNRTVLTQYLQLRSINT